MNRRSSPPLPPVQPSDAVVTVHDEVPPPKLIDPFLSPCCNDIPLGYEVRGVYDGVLFWLCRACGSAWVRRGWVGDRKWMAQAFVDAINASRRITDA